MKTKRQSGFAITYIICGIALLGVLSALGYGAYYSMTKGHAFTSNKVTTSNLLAQASYILTTESIDVDGDGFYEAPVMKTGVTPVPTGGGQLPDSTGAPKKDAWGTPFGYCSWDHGSTNSSTGRITGNNPGAMSNVVFAVLSAGADKTFNTTCADLASGTVKGDDGAKWVNANQIRQGVGGTVYFGDPVNTYSDLTSLNPSSLKVGELRVVKNDNKLYKWNGTLWDQVGGGSSLFQSAVRAKRTSAQSFTAEAWTKIQLNEEDWDGLNEFDTTNHRFTTQATGKYLIGFDVDLNTGSCKILAMIFVNNSSAIPGESADLSPSSSTFVGTALEIPLVATDIVELYFYSYGDSTISRAVMTIRRVE